MNSQAQIWSTAEHLASALFSQMPLILESLDAAGGATSTPQETEANHAAWRTAVARVIAAELNRMRPDIGFVPTQKTGSHYLLKRKDVDEWERDLTKVAHGEASDVVLALVRSRMIAATAAAPRFTSPN